MKITLCGSTRFIDSFHEWNLRLTREGHLVYSVATATSQHSLPVDPELKLVLDAVHIAKIEESDEIFVITGDYRMIGDSGFKPYIGESTAREIYYADLRGKGVKLDYRSWLHLGKSSVNHILSDMGFMDGRGGAV